MNDPSKDTLDHSRAVAKLTRSYAQNRSLGVAVGLLLFSGLSAAIGILSAFAGIGYRYGNPLLLWPCVGLLVLTLAAVIYLSVPRWGGRWLEKVARHLYPEGNVSISVPSHQGRRILSMVMGIVFGCCVLGTVLLGLSGYIPAKYAQPVSALYVVPFLVGLYLLMRPAVGPVSLLWPILYGLHAILIVAGVPLAFSGPWEVLNIPVPMIVYGLAAALLGHAVNRYALSQLKRTTQIANAGLDVGEGASQQ